MGTGGGLFEVGVQFVTLVRRLLILPSIFLMAFTVSLEGQVTYSLTAFAVSSFNNHSLLSTVFVVQGVVNGVFYSHSLLQISSH